MNTKNDDNKVTLIAEVCKKDIDGDIDGEQRYTILSVHKDLKLNVEG